jgi:hypothetical protein
MKAVVGFFSSLRHMVPYILWLGSCQCSTIFFVYFSFLKEKLGRCSHRTPPPPLHPTMQLTSSVICYTHRQTGRLHSKGHAQKQHWYKWNLKKSKAIKRQTNNLLSYVTEDPVILSEGKLFDSALKNYIKYFNSVSTAAGQEKSLRMHGVNP